MTPAVAFRLLIVFALLELALATAMFVVFHNVAVGASLVAVAGGLLAMSVAVRKKSNG